MINFVQLTQIIQTQIILLLLLLGHVVQVAFLSTAMFDYLEYSIQYLCWVEVSEIDEACYVKIIGVVTQHDGVNQGRRPD